MSTEGFQKTLEMEKVEGGESKTTLESVKYHGWKSMPYVIGNETFEKLGTIGTLANLLVYLTSVFHFKSITAVTMMNIFNGTTNMAPVLGAFISDTYLGRYATIGFASLASLLGMVLLTLTAAIPALHPPPCKGNQQECKGPTLSQLSVLISAFFLFTIGAGGIRPCNLAFGADQFNPKTESGRKDITSFFNWYYCTFTVAVMISSTLIIYVQSNISWTLGLAIPAVLMLFSCIAFFIGTRLYVRVKPEGSPFTSFAQVVVAAFKKRRVNLPELPEKELFDPPLHSSLVTKLPHTDQFKILDKAAAITSKDEIKSNSEGADPWRLCTLQQVEEVKCFVRIIPVWTCGVMFSFTLSQQSYVVYQALQMDRRLGKSDFKIPAGSFVVFNMLALTLWIPIYDRLIVPQLRKITKRPGGITMLQRIGIGIVISILGTVVSAIVEKHRRDIALHKPTVGKTSTGEAVSSMSSLWLLPQLILFGLSEAFTIIGQNEFYYQQFPENMRSIAGAMLFLGMSISCYASGVLVTIVHKVTGRNGSKNWLAEDLNEARLDLFYMMIAGAAVLNFVYFIVCAKWYRVKGTENGAEPMVVSERKEEKSLSV
ncbi:protein NRT1/ PTR FAMILY 2.11-like protein [Carex littledalei]|uniref:Protein NRT1/ PTR FAMILY 2.11-like protein n=1 Tax=Carex littledalei TaxID=544730 RepID=A0A833R4B8_9POAL|nr:protein NRT1/ PTR FAMILY 2.11-like protein [Carex littledalei]